MKKSKIFAGVLFGMMIIIMILTITFTKKETQIETSLDNNVEIIDIEHSTENDKNNGEYHEEGVKYNYNYIINGDELKKFNIAYEIIENLGNDTNQLFQDAGIYNEELKIYSISSKGTYVNFQIKPIHSSEKIVYVECTKKSNNYTIYLKE